jgi:hypothetical protein
MDKCSSLTFMVKKFYIIGTFRAKVCMLFKSSYKYLLPRDHRQTSANSGKSYKHFTAVIYGCKQMRQQSPVECTLHCNVFKTVYLSKLHL